ncbi:unnamed protein product [Acanthoscelides obtectus]|uniref:Uncharacterized protein n=1 Tax=Acanthoscelides obtectus TaxID=200917 RepID=A0A9P0JLT8_ACAOB|nr:unnamed protein product [Acanthoscelides obtectus]CAK1628984.1 hypothetical protein AOBTE_LOCUS5502 [Acanthoscelides obtectus]
MYRVIVAAVIISLIGFCVAQVNFSPNWGKRALNGDNEPNCKENIDTIMLIYKIIQNEAQKLIECGKLSN